MKPREWSETGVIVVSSLDRKMVQSLLSYQEAHYILLV